MLSCVSSRNIVTCIQIKLIEYQGGGCDASVNIVMGMMIPGMLLSPGLAGEAGGPDTVVTVCFCCCL